MGNIFPRLQKLTSQNRLIPRASDPAGFFWGKLDSNRALIGAAQYAAIVQRRQFLESYMIGNGLKRKGQLQPWGKLNSSDLMDQTISRKVLVVLSSVPAAGAKEVLLVANNSLGRNPLDFTLVGAYPWSTKTGTFDW